jgi:hypothetical protein
MGTPRNKSWVELLEEEEILREQERAVPVDDNLICKVKTEVNEVLANDNIVNSGEESTVDVNVKEELENQEDEEARLQKEFDIIEHEWVREIKQEQLVENQVQDVGVTHLTTVIKQENDKTGETCEVARYWVDIPSEVEVERAKQRFFCEQIIESLDADNQILRGGRVEKLHTFKLEETENTESSCLHLDGIKEVSRKRARNSQNDNKRQKVSHRYVYCIFYNTLFLVRDLTV